VAGIYLNPRSAMRRFMIWVAVAAAIAPFANAEAQGTVQQLKLEAPPYSKSEAAYVRPTPAESLRPTATRESGKQTH
jgi:hypothetical protein